jgi:hypothetical protein
MLLSLILNVYLLSHLQLPLFLIVTLTLTPVPTHARTLHRWGSLTAAHHHVPAVDIDYNTSDPGADPNLPGTVPMPDPSHPSAANDLADDWLKWHHERHLQQDMLRRLECRSVEFGRCEIQRQRQGVGIENEVKEVVTEAEQDDRFVGNRLPRHLQDWLARQAGGGS